MFDIPNHQYIAKDYSEMDTGDIPSLEELTQNLLDTDTPILGCIPKELIQKLVQSARGVPRDYNINMEEQSIQHLQNFVQHQAASANRSLCDVSNNDSSKLSTYLAVGHCHHNKSTILSSSNRLSLQMIIQIQMAPDQKI